MAIILEWEAELARIEDKKLFSMVAALETVSSWDFLAGQFEGIRTVYTLARMERDRRLMDAVEYLRAKSLNDIDAMFQKGELSEEVVLAYIAEWNKGLKFTRAVLKGGAVKNIVKEDDFGDN